MRRKDQTTAEKTRLVQFLLQNHSKGRIKGGKLKEAANTFNLAASTVKRVWTAAKKQLSAGQVITVESLKITKERSKRVIIDLELIAGLPLQKRSTIRRLAEGIGCKKSTVGNWVQRGLIKARTSAIKPDLKTPNKLLRLRFSLEAIEYDRILKVLQFKSMFNTVHIDEKWFYITKSSNRFYMTPAEANPHRTCKNKKFITKVMFMCAVCRPILGEDGSIIFDGKIGIFPFTEEVEAIRGSKKRPAETSETKATASITKAVIKDCLLLKILPAIKLKWPASSSKNILIQQDNARPHISDKDLDFRAAASSDGFNIKLVQQPPNSPDTNVKDLGWFRAIQSIQVESASYNVTELVNLVIKSFDELCPKSLNNVFLSLQCCMVEILKVKGQNCYKIPHMKKGALARQGILPINIQVSEILVREAIQYFIEAGIVEGIDDLKYQLGIHNF